MPDLSIYKQCHGIGDGIVCLIPGNFFKFQLITGKDQVSAFPKSGESKENGEIQKKRKKKMQFLCFTYLHGSRSVPVLI